MQVMCRCEQSRLLHNPLFSNLKNRKVDLLTFSTAFHAMSGVWLHFTATLPKLTFENERIACKLLEDLGFASLVA